MERDSNLTGLRFGEGGRYEIRERIGRGSMADVYKAVDTALNNRLYALKVLTSSMSPENAPVVRTMFIEEAKALARIRDANVVSVHSNGRLPNPDETPYMLMEYLDGRDLSAALKAQPQLGIEHAVDIQLAVCAGVHACHLADVIHRDLKPANIFLENTPKGEEPKVLDFSVAKVPIDRQQTQTDFVVGTESYMAPEQASGKPADERSDQYSLGALLYRCLTGKLPKGFLAKPREVRSEIPEALETVLLQAMAANPDDRFPSVHDYGRHLLPFSSEVGQAKWRQYYTTPVTGLRPAFTGPVLQAEAPVTAAAPVVTQVVAPYDFGAHERTTSVADSSTPAPSSVSPVVVADASPEAGRKGRARRWMVVAGLMGVVAFGGGLFFYFRGAGHGAARAPDAPAPTWLHASGVHDAATSESRAEGSPEGRSPPTASERSPDTVPAVDAAAPATPNERAPETGPARRPKHVKKRAVRTTPDGIPLLP